MKHPSGVVVKSTFELAALPCYPQFGVALRDNSRDEPVFATVSLGLLSGGLMMVWLQQNADAKEPVALFSQTSELMTARSEAIDQSRFELPAHLPAQLPRRL